MAGKKQHFVPRFLQDGFRSGTETQKSSCLTWLYRPGVAPVDVSLKDVGHSEWFYTFRRNGVTVQCADGAITDAEGAWMSGLVRNLRENAGFDLGAHHDEIARLLSHLVLRNRAIWKLIEAPAAPLFDRLRDAAQDPVWLAGAIKQLLETNRPFFEQELSTMFPGADISALVHQVETALVAADMPQMSDGAMPMLKYLHEDLMPRVLKVFRVQTMVGALMDPGQYELFRDCSFEVARDAEGCLIQGDTPVVFHRADGRGFTPVPSEGEDFDYAYLPLSPSVVFIASKGGKPQSWDTLRQASAACSHTYFIAAEQSTALVTLTQTIAESFPVLTEQQINGMFAETLDVVGSFDSADTERTAVLDTLFSDFLKPNSPKLTNA